MKGFPNQVTDIEKLTKALRIRGALEENQGAPDDGAFGEALVHAGIAGTGHGRAAMPIDDYLRVQRKKARGKQSHRTTARGLRELFRILGLLDEQDRITRQGRDAASFDGPLSVAQIELWRILLRDMQHKGGQDEASHPYQVLLRLVARQPGISRAKCALALEARNDSPEELERIVELSSRDEEGIPNSIGISKPTWDNAKKILPSFAEQLGDVVKSSDTYVLASAPGSREPAAQPDARSPRVGRPGQRVPRRSREVTPDTIGRAGTADDFDEIQLDPELDPRAARDAIRQRLDRLRRHNLIVKSIAKRLSQTGAALFEDPFDILALTEGVALLGEVKTLDGSPADERSRVQEALAQLLYYEAFVTAPIAGSAVIKKFACFERRVSDEHQRWLNAGGIATTWMNAADRVEGDAMAREMLGGNLIELR